MTSSQAESCVAIAVYRNIDDADIGLQCLEKTGYTRDDVSIIRQGDQAELTELAKKAPESNANDNQTDDSTETGGAAASGAALGGSTAAALSVATLIGPFMIAGPVLGAITGAAAGSGIASLSHYGFDHDMTASIEKSLAEGGIAIVAHGDQTATQEAARVLSTTPIKDLYHLDEPA